MTEIRLYDTLAREKRVFTPADPERVTMYVCGPTVYNRAHIGNARPAVVFDVLARLLRHAYGANSLVYAAMLPTWTTRSSMPRARRVSIRRDHRAL
jgi:cysteinyl-tRNA synthetase